MKVTSVENIDWLHLRAGGNLTLRCSVPWSTSTDLVSLTVQLVHALFPYGHLHRSRVGLVATEVALGPAQLLQREREECQMAAELYLSHWIEVHSA